jgi:hypothetical protein
MPVAEKNVGQAMMPELGTAQPIIVGLVSGSGQVSPEMVVAHWRGLFHETECIRGSGEESQGNP